MRLTTLLTWQEYKTKSDEAVARNFWRNDRRVFLPGMGWLNEWYFDPKGGCPNPMCKVGDPFLSIHYWRDWANKRPPIEVVCPNGDVWCPDRKSSNGDGWAVTGEWPNLTCTPSIVAGDYHGFLRGGEFTLDLSGKTWPTPNIPANYGRPSPGT
jgi:hypothetical protein